ncbi:MAG: DEAD/DEAH box helicase family protein [Spirochaetaceae bacterium]|jgi:predicted helicase|nr:DEAD/DEAH box helicase family protein [Spirochaetaceae bacterium]
MNFGRILQKYRDISFSERDKGYRFEYLIRSFLKIYPVYRGELEQVWLWSEFPAHKDFGSGDKDLGIDLVAKTRYGEYWAIQCKCYQEDAVIDKPKVDTFLSTSGKSFFDTQEIGKKVNFVFRLWIDTTRKGFNNEAFATIQNQTPQVGRLGFYDLENAPVDWAELDKGISGEKSTAKKYETKPHQQTAINCVQKYFETQSRGKLIMACGTGKTYTSLRIAENETGDNGLVLFLVPSIALLGQALREWKCQSIKPIYPVCICSDAGVSKAKDDVSSATLIDLALPASTDINNIIHQLYRARLTQKNEGGMIVIFSTYQSIEVIHNAQKKMLKEAGKWENHIFGAEPNVQNSELRPPVFDLIICDEAHRTTGVTLSGDDESAFVKVHDEAYLKAAKRLYMTATPRLYSEQARNKAKEDNAVLCSMDDAALYGEEMYRIGFGEAVNQKLLSDYKVIVLTIAENTLTEALRNSIRDKNEEINAEDALKIIGCINALSKKSLRDHALFEEVDPAPMRSAVAFCQNIAVSKSTATAFNDCRDAYFAALSETERQGIVMAKADHVDGKMGAQIREQKLFWLKSADAEKRECHILNNVRCLSEGVDVPSLDAVMFLSARNSQIDVVQSVGRVMRIAPDKKYGYIIIPVVVLPEAEPEKTLASDRFKVVWQVLNALRAHDDRFNAVINKIDLNHKKPDQIWVCDINIGVGAVGGDGESYAIKTELQKQLELEFRKFQSIVYAKMVQKCGTRLYWEQWASDVAKIAARHIESITEMVKNERLAKEEFERYLAGLRKNINPSVTGQDAIEMLAQHIITQPVFEALFEDYSFVKNNTVSTSLQGIIDVLNEKTQKEDADKLDRFYASVQQRAKDIDNAEAKQKIIVELYDKFFRTAFPKVTEKLGIVYTPVEVVDFIIHSVEDILRKEFGRSMTDENVHILDPFTGTGTFITRLLQSGIIKQEDLERKYTKELHANEIVLLAYYIASINIENVYHDIMRGKPSAPRADFPLPPSAGFLENHATPLGSYRAFSGICLTDTFQLGETTEGENLFSEIFPQNSERVLEQKKTPLRVIMGNPPYSVGQKSANDNAQNQSYPKLEARIAETYVAASSANLNKAAYDSYIKAFRWASDRLDPENGGIIGFVSNGSWLDSNGLDGFRKCLEDEFSSVYVYNLRGNCRTSGELRQKEAGNVFGLGSRTPVAVTILVKRGKSGNTDACKKKTGEYNNE